MAVEDEKGRLEIVIAGFAGRMGQEVARAALAEEGIHLLGGLEEEGHPLVGKRWHHPHASEGIPVEGELLRIPGVQPRRESPGDDLPRQVLIEFCLAEGALRHARAAAERDLALVSGSTAMSPEGEEELRRMSSRIPVFRAPNFSRGAAVLIGWGPKLARALGREFDVEILECHHRGKRDIPSGTALALAEGVARARGEGQLRTGRRAEDGPRGEGEIGLHGIRAGGMVGEHRLLLGGQGETLELVHRVMSREAFARGSLGAAGLVSRLGPGYYGMEHLLAEGKQGRGGTRHE